MKKNIEEFASHVLTYMQTHEDYEMWTKEEAIRQALRLLCSDIGAAQDFLITIGVEYDLYAT